jgi:hypothetical protein
LPGSFLGARTTANPCLCRFSDQVTLQESLEKKVSQALEQQARIKELESERGAGGGGGPVELGGNSLGLQVGTWGEVLTHMKGWQGHEPTAWKFGFFPETDRVPGMKE